MGNRLIAIAGTLRDGREVDTVSVRSFLGWFGAQRRGWQIVEQIRGKLAEAGLVTVPDFESAWIDNRIRFELRPPTHQEDSEENRANQKRPWTAAERSIGSRKIPLIA